jgi:hypothetical protein
MSKSPLFFSSAGPPQNYPPGSWDVLGIPGWQVCFYHTMHQEAQKIRNFAEMKKSQGTRGWLQRG